MGEGEDEGEGADDEDAEYFSEKRIWFYFVNTFITVTCMHIDSFGCKNSYNYSLSSIELFIMLIGCIRWTDSRKEEVTYKDKFIINSIEWNMQFMSLTIWFIWAKSRYMKPWAKSVFVNFFYLNNVRLQTTNDTLELYRCKMLVSSSFIPI